MRQRLSSDRCIETPRSRLFLLAASMFGLAIMSGCGDAKLPSGLVPTTSQVGDSDETDGEVSDETHTTNADATSIVDATSEKEVDPEVFREELLASARNGYFSEKQKETEDWQVKELSLLKAVDAGLVNAHAGELATVVEEAEQAIQAWERDVVPLWTNDVGKQLASDENRAMAVLRQSEVAAVPRLRQGVAICKAALSSWERGKTKFADQGRSEIHEQLKQLEIATSGLPAITANCVLARETIRQYASTVETLANESEDRPTLQSVTDRLTQRQLSEAVSELKAAGYTEELSPEEAGRFKEEMLAALPTLEASAETLRSMPESLRGTRGRGLGIVLRFNERIGPQFSGSLLFLDQNSTQQAGFVVVGEVVDSELQFRTTKMSAGSRVKYDVDKGFNYEGKIGPRKIEGKYYLHEVGLGGREFVLNHGTLSFNRPPPN